MKRYFLLLMLLFPFFFGVKANPVDIVRVRQMAANFLNVTSDRSAELMDVTAEAGFSNVYVFTTENSFVLMAADDRVQPILGYSLNGRFDYENMPANKRAWIQGYSTEIQYAIENQTRASLEVTQLWRDLEVGNSNSDRAITVVAPLIQTQWDQDEPYNNLCPDGTVTGCAATAMAQVLKYWNYPPTGIGVHSYQWNGQTVSADFGSTTYDWNNMLNSYGGNSTEAQRMAVATLMFHCGVSLDMNYGWSGSGALSSKTAGAFINYFNYSSETQLLTRSNYSDTQWINMVKAELNLNHPIWYCGTGSGGGHAFVCDGYNSGDYFHFNWGWSGYCDEYYSLNSLSPGTGGIGSGSMGDYSNNQQALFGAQPSSESAASAPVLTANLVTGSGVRNAQLSWNQVNNAVSYSVYRNGTLIHTTASGSETSYLDVHIAYGTTIYYIRSVDENGVLSWASNYAPVTITFPAPTNLTAVQVDGGIQLSWTPCEGALAYNVYCNNVILANGISQTSFFDNRPIAGELNYFIRGVDSFGDESESSNNVSLTIPFSTPVVDDLEASVSGNSVELSWSAPDWCYPATPTATMTYGDGSVNGYFGVSGGSGNGMYWGHRFTASNLNTYDNMFVYKVSFYAKEIGTYKVFVYKGTTADHPQTQVLQQTVLAGAVGWFEVDLLNTIQIDASQDLWVYINDPEFKNTPAAFCSYSGEGGNYYSTNPTSWVNTRDNMAFLIRTFVSDGTYSYNLYRNGTSIANNLSNTFFSDTNLALGTYTYYVKTNYYAGESDASNQVSVIIGNTGYTISASANPSMGGTISGGGAFAEGATCTLMATPNEGYTFTNWTENGSVVSSNANYTFTVNANRNLVANFTVRTFTVTATSEPAVAGTVLVDVRGDRNQYSFDFEDGTFQGWTLLKGNNSTSPNNWMHCSDYTPRNFSSGYGYNSSDGFMLSESYISSTSENSGTPVYPDNYLVSPQVLLGGNINFYAGVINTSYCAEKFSVMVSTTDNTNTDSFTTVETWTFTPTVSSGSEWQEFSVDLSAYSGMGYIAIHHFDCNNQWLLCIDDITIVEGESNPGYSSGTFSYGQSCTVTAIPNSGYHFVNWTENGSVVSSNANYTFTVVADRTLVANFSYNGGGTTSFHFVTAGNWSTASNWEGGALPGADDETFIDAPCQLDMDATVNVLTVSDGQSLTLQSGKTLNVSGTLINTSATSLIIEDGAQLVHSSENVSATVKKNITGHGTNKGRYYLLSNPLASAVNPELTSIYRLTRGNYDLYDWLPSAPDNLEWRNFKDDVFMMLPEGCGYLYANQNGVELNFPGTLKPSHVRFSKTVSYDVNDSEHPGWNLIGNPFMCNAYLVDGNNELLPYYRMNSAGNGFEAVTSGAIAPMEGVLYHALENGTVYFTRTDSSSQIQNYMINVSANPTDGGSVSGGGTYQQGQNCTVIATANSGFTFTNWTENGNVVSTNASYSFTVNANRYLVANFNYNGGGGDEPAGAINGLFTINANGDKVYFSQGNLQYNAIQGYHQCVDGTTQAGTWRFAENQWDYIGENNSNISQTYNGWIDLFGWGTSGWNSGNIYYHPWDYSGDCFQYGPIYNNLTGANSYADWGVYNAIENGGNSVNMWRLLSAEEWMYVFDSRNTSSGIRYAMACINNVNGVVLLPDDWNDNYYLLVNTNTNNASFSSNIISSNVWLSSLESHGAVFFPAAGGRYGTSCYSFNTKGYYSSSSYFEQWTTLGFFFMEGYMAPNYNVGCPRGGHSVRLVQDYNR